MKRAGQTPAAALQLALYRVVVAAVRMWALLVSNLTADAARRERWRERRGHWDGAADADAEAPLIWLHAASVGETRIAMTLAAALRSRLAGVRLLLTCNTVTARAVAAKAQQFDAVRYFPLDHPAVLAPILERLEPAAFIFVETEIWPYLLIELERRGIPAALVNGRISDRSFPRYRLAPALMRRVLATLSAVCSRDACSYERLLFLGASPACTAVTGDIKLDAFEPRALESTPDLIAGCGVEEPVLVAASTHEGEEGIVLDAFERVLREVSGVRLVIAPRHPERAAQAVSLAEARGHRVAVWSSWKSADEWCVMVVDTVGDLLGFMKGAAAVFVGGSLVPVGGHNLMEPAAFAVPAATGPELATVEAQAQALAGAGALHVVRSGGELAELWSEWLRDGEQARSLGAKARAVLEHHRGAIERSLQLLCRHGVV